MKTLVLFSLSLAVALAKPPFPPEAPPNPDEIKEEQSPLLGDVVPVQGHVEVEAPAPQPKLDSEEQQGKVPAVVVNMEQMEKQSASETEVKEQPQVQVEKEGEGKEEVKVEEEVKKEEVKAEADVKVEEEGEEKTEVKVEEEAKPEFKQVEVDPEPDFKVESEVKVEVNQNSEVMAEQDVDINPDAEMEQEPDLRVESEVKVEPDVQIEPQPEDDDMFDEEFEVHMKLETKPEPDLDVEEKHMDEVRSYETMGEPIVELEPQTESETDLEVQERHIDMERNFEMMGDGEPIVHLEALDDDEMVGREEEENRHRLEELKSIRAEFVGQDGEEEEDDYMRKSDNVLGEEPIMQLEPEEEKESFQNEEMSPDAAFIGEGPALDILGKPISQMNDYFPNDEAKMRMEPLTKEESYYMMMEEPESSNMRLFQQENGPRYGGEEQMMMSQTGQRSCPGVVLEGKCYQFYKGPKRAEDAEYFCQTQFPLGHLASITNSHIHTELMNLMRQNGAFTRTWIGGLRYLDTGRFVWLDGSHWGYADWLTGEPNHTSKMENCLEVLANGKFNDFTCWEPQAFICSYPYQ